MPNLDHTQFSKMLQSAITEPGIISAAYSAFHNYSIGNQFAAYGQCAARNIPVGPIATYKAWQDKGRNVKKGEKAIELCMPVTMKGERKNEQGETETYAFNRFIFRKNWFVLSQTEGEDYANEQITPEWDKTKALESLKVLEIPFDMADGNCQGYAKAASIAVSPIAQYPHKTRFHELAHVVLGHTGEGMLSDNERTPRNIREVEAESVAFILCNILNLDGATESRGYIQAWLDGNEINEKSSQKIFSAADKILKAGQVQS